VVSILYNYWVCVVADAVERNRSPAKNREFSENSTPEQGCDGHVASGPSKFDRDLRWLNDHLGSFLLLRWLPLFCGDMPPTPFVAPASCRSATHGTT
jgi:hypothetical protein